MAGTSTFLSDPQNPTYAYVGAFVDELQRSGLRNVVICPGSRSTPLALAFAGTPALRCWMHIDERSAAFFALGMAKRLNEPVALLCTSGTASANFLPAVAEAHLTHLPLLVLTADRPHELRDCGAPQAIDQNHLYGTHVKWFVDTALPEATNEALRYIRTIADRAMTQTRTIPSGPVHLNMPFREPLTPAALPNQPMPPLDQRDTLAWQGRSENRPYTQVHADGPAQTALEADMVLELAEKIASSPQGLIIVGPQIDAGLSAPLLQLAQKTGYPILADPLSQLRGVKDSNNAIVSSYDAFLHAEHFLARHRPQLVLRFGSMPTSKPVLLYLKRYASTCQQVIIDPHHGWDEPTQLAEQIFYAEADSFIQELMQALDHLDTPINTHTGQEKRAAWTATWQETEQTTRQTLSTAIADFPELFEGRVFTELAELLPASSLLYVGNSMPIRDMDTFFWPQARTLRCLGNRGANGIDGVISSALGASAAGGSDEQALLVIGDLSFFHDQNGLLAARLHRLNLTIVLVNNDGGGIFSFLPQATYPEHFEQLFGTPTGLDFRPVVEMYGGTYERVTDWETFRRAISNNLAVGGLRVVEIQTERASNVTMHRQLWQFVEHALEETDLLSRDEA